MTLSLFARMKLYCTGNVLRNGSVVLAKIVIIILFGVIELSNNLYLQDKEIRERLKDSEYKLGLSMPIEKAKDRTTQLQSEVTLLERYLYIFFGFRCFALNLIVSIKT